MSSSANAVSESTKSITQNIPVAIEFGKLRRSKKNMRTITPKNSPEDRELLASIRANGILQNLCAYQVGDTFEVPAGGRRFGVLEYLFKHKEITAEFPVYCLVIAEEDATDTSLIENYQRKAPHAADVYIAFSELIKQGRTVASIARSHGIAELQVEKYLRLGKVHKTLFKLFRQDKLTLDQIMAFASTPDTKLQIAIFKAIGEDCGNRPQYIREQLQSNRHSSETALAKLVTVEAYREAGGAVEHDLFTNTTMFCDVEILVRIAEEKLCEVAASIKGWGWVRTSMEGAYALHSYQRLPNTSKKKPVPKPDADALKILTKQYNQLCEEDDAGWTDEQYDKYEHLEDELEELKGRIDRECTSVSEKHMPFGGCVVTFSQKTGAIEIHKGLLTKEDVQAFHAKDATGLATDDEQADKSTIKLKPEISSRLMDDLGLYRRGIIKAELASATTIALDLLHYQLCMNVLGSGQARYCRVLDISISTVNDESSIGDYKKTEAAKSLVELFAKLDTGWLSLKTDVKQFEAFRALPSVKRQSLVAYCVATQLLSGKSKPGSNKLIDSIAAEIGIDFKQYWRPTGENYFARLTKPLLLALGKKWRGVAWVNAHSNDSKKSLVDGFHQLFHGSKAALTEKEQAIGAEWIPTEIDK